MSFIIVTSNLWSLLLREWRGADPRAVRLLVAGNIVIVASTGLIGWGNYLTTHAGN
jgi:L-rhamnose-H+ transport protein